MPVITGSYPQFAHRSLIPNLMMGFLARIGLIEKEYYCENCHYTWPKDGTKRSICIRRESPIVSSTESNKPCCGRSRRDPSPRANGLPRYPELGLSLTEIRTAGVVMASGRSIDCGWGPRVFEKSSEDVSSPSAHSGRFRRQSLDWSDLRRRGA